MSKPNNVEFQIVSFGSAAYKECISLRQEVLLNPLGLTFSQSDLESEKDQIHIAGYVNGQLCATSALVPKDGSLQMKRVAVKSGCQNMGLGTAMLIFCEKYARTHGYASIFCHARSTAIPFYQKNVYLLEGEPFEEAGIPHHKMRKFL